MSLFKFSEVILKVDCKMSGPFSNVLDHGTADSYSYLSDNSPGLLAFHEAFSASKTAY